MMDQGWRGSPVIPALKKSITMPVDRNVKIKASLAYIMSFKSARVT